MKYYQVIITTEDTESVIEELAGLDIFEYQIEDPADLREIMDNKSQYDWDLIDEDLVKNELSMMPRVSVFFEDAGRTAQVASKFIDAEIRTIDDADWKEKYKEQFKALALTENIVVCPSWEEVPKGDYKIISLDPGMAFGTGDHATTSMCAQLMEKWGCEGKKVLDVGTGSGILAIGAALMGAGDVLGIDIDDDAVAVAHENVAKNGCSDKIKIVKGDLTEGVDYEADLVVANIIAELVIELAKDIKKHLKPGGPFICSGILVEKSEMVTNALLDLGFQVDDIFMSDDWCAIGAHYE